MLDNLDRLFGFWKVVIYKQEQYVYLIYEYMKKVFIIVGILLCIMFIGCI